MVRLAWERWAPRLRGRQLAQPSDYRPHFDDVVLATRGDLPSRLMRPDLRTVPLIDWSELALATFNPEGSFHPVPLWAGVAALRACGFGGDVLRRLVVQPPGSEPLTEDDFKQMVETVPGSGPGALLILDDTGGLAAEPPVVEQPPTLAVRESQLSVYGRTIDWLVEREALTAVVDGRI